MLKHIQDFLLVLFYLLIAIILVYYIPAPLNKIFFLLILPIVWFSNRDYIWLAFFFVIGDIPGGLFSGGLSDDPYRLPIYKIFQGVSFTIRELYLILILVKVILKPECFGNRLRNHFKNDFALLAIYFVILIGVSLIFGVSSEGLRNIYKIIINLSLFISIPYILGTRINFHDFLNTLFPFTIVAVLLQIYSLTHHQQIVALFKPDSSIVQGILGIDGNNESWQRPIEMIHVLLVCFVGSLYNLKNNTKRNKAEYFIIINFLSFLGIFLTGTRSWFIAIIIVHLSFLLIRMQKISFAALKKILTLLVIVAITLSIPTFREQIGNVWSRFTTLETFIEGDITAGGTSARFDVRGPTVIKAYKASSIFFGAGFSSYYFQNQDGHVGYHNILLNTGIIGFSLFIAILIRSILIPYRLSRIKSLPKYSKKELRMSFLLLLALAIINIGTQTIGYTLAGNNRYFLLALSFVFINQAIESARIIYLKSKVLTPQINLYSNE